MSLAYIQAPGAVLKCLACGQASSYQVAKDFVDANRLSLMPFPHPAQEKHGGAQLHGGRHRL